MKAFSNVEGAFIVHEGDPMNEVLFIICFGWAVFIMRLDETFYIQY
jgi:hypothetical protein